MDCSRKRETTGENESGERCRDRGGFRARTEGKCNREPNGIYKTIFLASLRATFGSQTRFTGLFQPRDRNEDRRRRVRELFPREPDKMYSGISREFESVPIKAGNFPRTASLPCSLLAPSRESLGKLKIARSVERFVEGVQRIGNEPRGKPEESFANERTCEKNEQSSRNKFEASSPRSR